MFAGCDNSGKQQGTSSAKSGAANGAYSLCTAIVADKLAKQCAVNSRESTVDIMIDSLDDEAARNVCADIADKTMQLTAHLSGQWKLQVFSPYRSDKPMATCRLH